MKYIDKTSQKSKLKAVRLDNWVKDWCKRYPKRKPNYKEDFRKTALNNYSRTDLYQDLWDEQNGFCCYCGQSIPHPLVQSGTASVEHIVFQKISKNGEDLTYANMILSCMGKEHEEIDFGKINFLSNKYFHCNLKRGSDSKTIIDPTNTQYNTSEKDCWRLFNYIHDFNELVCEIKPKRSVDNLTKDTIEVLGLNCDFLRRKRGKVYSMYLNQFLYSGDNDYDDGSKRGKIGKAERNTQEKVEYFKKELNFSRPFCSMNYAIMQHYLEINELKI